jgi:trans-aconitate methyltransferase
MLGMNNPIKEETEWDSILRYDLPESAAQFLEELAKRINKIIERVNAKVIAEIGCGRGELIHSLAKESPRCAFVGYDQSIEAVSRLSASTLPNEEFHQLALPQAPDRMFDCVLCINTLHYVAESLLSIERLWSITRPGGVMVFNYPNRYYAALLPKEPQDEDWGAAEEPMRMKRNLLTQRQIRKALHGARIDRLHKSGPHSIYLAAEKRKGSAKERNRLSAK